MGEYIEDSQVPHDRFHDSPIYDTAEWKNIWRAIRRGIEKGKAFMQPVSQETIAELPYKEPLEAIVTQLRRHLERENSVYGAELKRDPVDDVRKIYVRHRDVMSNRREKKRKKSA